MSLLTSTAMPATWGGVPLVRDTAGYAQVAALLAAVVGILQVRQGAGGVAARM